MSDKINLQVKIKSILQDYKESNCVNTQKAENQIMQLVNPNWIKINNKDDLPNEIMFIECINKNGEPTDIRSHWLHHYRPTDKNYIMERASYWKAIPFNSPKL